MVSFFVAIRFFQSPLDEMTESRGREPELRHWQSPMGLFTATLGGPYGSLAGQQISTTILYATLEQGEGL